MKNLVVFCAFFLLAHAASAQFAFGLKGGVNTEVGKPGDILVGSGDTAFNFGIDKFKYGTQFGVWVRLGDKVFIQPELVFNSNKTDYKFKENNLADVVKNEKYQYLDMPVMLGFGAGPFRVSGGPVGHYFINSNSELTDIHGYKARFKQFSWGWQAGLTIGRGRVSADLRYEGNFSKQGDHVTFFGDQYNFSNSPSRFILGVNLALVK